MSMRISPRISKIRRPPPYLRAAAHSDNQIVEIVNRGLVVDSDTVIAKRLPDGRVQLFLNPKITSQFQ